MADQNKASTPWSLGMNLSDAKARTGVPGTFTEPTTGAYKAVIKYTEPHTASGSNTVGSIMVQLGITEGEFTGVESRIYLGTDVAKAGNKNAWKTALLSAGFAESDLAVGEVEITSDMLDGKEVFVYVKAKDSNDPNSQSDRSFIIESVYNQLVSGDQAAPAAAAAPAPQLQVTPPKGGGLRGLVKPAEAAPAAAAPSVPQPRTGGLRSMIGNKGVQA